MRGRSITLTVAAALISAGTPAAQTPTTDHSGISTAAQTTETAGQAQSFEDRWPGQLRPRRRRLTSQAYLRRPRPLKQPAKPRVLRIDGPPKRQHPTCHRLHTFRRQPRRHLKRPAKLPCQRKWAQRWTVLAI
jgi:hypothetical protein